MVPQRNRSEIQVDKSKICFSHSVVSLLWNICKICLPLEEKKKLGLRPISGWNVSGTNYTGRASVSVWIDITVGFHRCWGLLSSWKAIQQQGREDYSGQWTRQHAVKTRHLIHTFIYLHRDKSHFILDSHGRYVLSVVTLVEKHLVAVNANQISNQTVLWFINEGAKQMKYN